MQILRFAVLCLVFEVPSYAKRREQSQANPVGKVIQLLTDLEAKITKEGEEAKVTFEKFSEWCEDRSKNLAFEIRTAKGDVSDLEASIQDANGKLGAFAEKIDAETASVHTDETDLAAAKGLRAKEAKEFGLKENDLLEVISMLERASAILEREMQKTGAAMVQVDKVPGVIDALQAIVASASIETQDASKLAAFIESSDSDSDKGVGAPAGAVYKSQSGSILDTLAGLSGKAEEQLDSARKAETAARHEFELLEQSLTDSIAVSTKQLARANKGVTETSGFKAKQEADLAMTSKSLVEAETSLSDTEQDCMTRAQDYEAEKVARTDELGALAAAKKVINEKTAGAESRKYSLTQVSFMQLGRSRLHSGTDLANFEVVRFVRGIAKKQHSDRLAQLARKMASVVQVAALNGGDPFEKVTHLISAMVERLEAEAGADATHKAYCDKELAETKVKKDEKTAEIAKLSAQIDSDSARSESLKAQIAELQKSLAALAKTQAEMDALRSSEKAEFAEAKADTESGIEGVKMALSILRDYYGGAGSASTALGSAEGIIGLLEVVESDFAKMLAQLTAAEASAAAEYDKTTKENQIEKATKESDVKYKTKEASQLDKAMAEDSADRGGVQDELAAVLEYNAKLEQECIEVAETYQERTARRAAEIAGLKEALAILENETALLERGVRRSRKSAQHVLRAA